MSVRFSAGTVAVTVSRAWVRFVGVCAWALVLLSMVDVWAIGVVGSTFSGAEMLSVVTGGHMYARMFLNLAPIVMLGEWVVPAGTLTTCVHAALGVSSGAAVDDRAPAWVVSLDLIAKAAFGSGTASLLTRYALTTCVPIAMLGVLSGVAVDDRTRVDGNERLRLQVSDDIFIFYVC